MHYYHITCRLPNASEMINGVEFETVQKGKGDNPVNHVQTVEAVDEVTARQFHGIAGYEIEPVDGAPSLDAPKEAAEVPPARRRGRPSKAEVAARAAAEAAAAAQTAPPVVQAPPA